MYKVINLTNKDVIVDDGSNRIVYKATNINLKINREVKSMNESVNGVGSVEIVRSISNLPPKAEGVLYIVHPEYLNISNRDDLIAPNIFQATHDKNGKLMHVPNFIKSQTTKEPP